MAKIPFKELPAEIQKFYIEQGKLHLILECRASMLDTPNPKFIVRKKGLRGDEWQWKAAEEDYLLKEKVYIQ